jgi:hypothetical protein
VDSALATEPSSWNPPADPERDLWWAAQRIAAPDTDDHTTRHQRGVVRLPWKLGDFTGYHHGPFTAWWEPSGGAR